MSVLILAIAIVSARFNSNRSCSNLANSRMPPESAKQVMERRILAWRTRLVNNAKPLWEEYFARLVNLARARLRSAPGGNGHEEDVALSALDSFCRGAAAGRFPRLDDREDLWQVLFLLTTRKAIGLVRHTTRKKRGDGRTEPMPDDVAAPDLSPELIAEVVEQCGRLLGLLGTGGLREVAEWKMEGYTNAEIGLKLGRSVQTVERKLKSIREIWKRETK